MTEAARMQVSGYERDQVVAIINSVINRIHEDDANAKESLVKELHGLKDIIDEARSEIGNVRASDIKGVHIPSATDELDAVVGATEEATGTIMDCCEAIQSHVSGSERKLEESVSEEIIKIFEACSFQDITGQRISKVVSTLQTIEDKVAKILGVLEQKIPVVEGDQSTDSADSAGDKALLNGPQLPDKAINQDDIDKILAEFDN